MQDQAVVEKGWGIAGAVFAVLAGMAALSIYLLEPPRPLPESAPATEFSAYRALRHDIAVASKPHPAGSPANDEVAAYIQKTMQDLGVETALVTDHYVRGHSAGLRSLVLGRIPGTANTKAFALVAHYDSVPYGPGAADDCAGVSAILEIARALKAGPPLMNDILFAFTDAEETGPADGAGLFADHLIDETGLVLNFEARGVQGASLLFETSPENGWMMREVAKAKGVYPGTSSMMYDVYKRLPFGSDFSKFRRAGMKGFNVAFIDNFAYYHTMNDNPATINMASFQHHGSYGLGFARHFGNIPLVNVTAPDATYFNVLGFHPLVIYPLSWHRLLSLIAAGVFLLTILFGLIRRHLSLGGLIAGVAAFFATSVVTVAVVEILLAIVFGPENVLHQFTKSFVYLPNLHALYNNNLYGAAFAFMGIAVFAFIYTALARYVRLQNLAAGALVWWLALLAALDFFLAGGAYLATWPLLFASIGLAILFRANPKKPLSSARLGASVLFVLPGVVFLAPIYRVFLSTVLIIAAPILTMLLVMLLGLLVPHLLLMTRPNRVWLPALAATASVVMIAFGLATNAYSPARLKLNSVAYGLNLDTKEAFWMTADDAPDEWTSQFFKSDTPKASVNEFMPWLRDPYKKAPAPIAPDLPGPDVQVISDSRNGETREIALRIVSPAKAARVSLQVVSDAKILRATVFGKPIKKEHGRGRREAGRRWGIEINPFPRDGAEVVIETDAAGPLKLNLIEGFYGQPGIPGVRPRPDYMAPEPNTTKRGLDLRGDHYFVTRTFEFP